ncbi:hypothetical protein AWH56_004495 [Anaerobacillus isosaccharinicus]|uniref:Uncharacterized protein n=1 Tax=Anaerobacillus isosaccharinicus TaxID=1532552 RepID=A0A7S7L9G2_9BACI|nr:hypothetical protein [Anaerobacillus isosaccharinicus]QOY36914.1 hypothetical protein AWH56_004495 [Anaerobacillus isosaccharinicus]
MCLTKSDSKTSFRLFNYWAEEFNKEKERIGVGDLKRFVLAIYICSLLIVTACGNEKQDSIGIVDFQLIPNETDIIAIHVGGVDEDGVSTDETNITIEEKQKIKKV